MMMIALIIIYGILGGFIGYCIGISKAAKREERRWREWGKRQ